MDIAVTGYAGYEGSKIIYADKDCRDKLLMRYSESFFGVFEDNFLSGDMREETSLSGLERLYAVMRDEGKAMDASDGGVLAALWRLLKHSGSGGVYSLRSIPVLQQTIEICEMFGLNPYRLYSPGCRVWIVEDMGLLRTEAAGAKVPFGVIGFTARGAPIRRMDTEADSSLRRPEPDGLLRLFGKISDQGAGNR